MKGLFRKTGAGLAPYDQDAVEFVGKLKQLEIVRVEAKRDRSLPQLRLYWALCNMLAENARHNTTRRSISDMLCMACDHVEAFRGVDGQIIYKPASLAFKNTEQEEFNAFFNRVLDLVCERVLPHMTPGEIKQNLEQITGAYNDDAA